MLGPIGLDTKKKELAFAFDPFSCSNHLESHLVCWLATHHFQSLSNPVALRQLAISFFQRLSCFHQELLLNDFLRDDDSYPPLPTDGEMMVTMVPKKHMAKQPRRSRNIAGQECSVADFIQLQKDKKGVDLTCQNSQKMLDPPPFWWRNVNKSGTTSGNPNLWAGMGQVTSRHSKNAWSTTKKWIFTTKQTSTNIKNLRVKGPSFHP